MKLQNVLYLYASLSALTACSGTILGGRMPSEPKTPVESSGAFPGGSGGGASTRRGVGGAAASGGSGGTAGQNPSSAGSGGPNDPPISGNEGGKGGMANDATVKITPQSTTVILGSTVTFMATVSGASGGVSWSVVEASGCGSVSADGAYTAPQSKPSSGFCHVKATSEADARLSASATIAVTEASESGATGVWIQAPIPVSLDVNRQNSGGAQTMVVDPVRPSDYYAFVTPENSQPTAVLKSTDFGRSWTNVCLTPEMYGNPWGATIDPNPNRDPSTPPTMYAPAGFGAGGIWKSTDGGANWTNLLAGATAFDVIETHPGAVDTYAIYVLPDNPPNHVLFTYHYNWQNSSDGGFGESTDGGKTWLVHRPPAGIGQSQYLVIVDKNTWVSIAQDNSGQSGTWKTTTAGRVNGTIDPAAWKRVANLEHYHGAFQSYIDSTGAIYVPTHGAVNKSTDAGSTWTVVYNASEVSNLVGTEKYLYVNHLYGPNALRAAKANDTMWASYTDVPSGLMGGGTPPYGAAASFDGTHWVVVITAERRGIWRYVEP